MSDRFKESVDACTRGDTHRFTQIIESLNDHEKLLLFSATDSAGNTLLHLAVDQRNKEITSYIISAALSLWVNKDKKDCANERPDDSDFSNQHILVKLIELQNNEGNTPLHLSAINSNTTLLRLLLPAVSNLSTLKDQFILKNRKDLSALHISAENGNQEFMQIVFQFRNNEGQCLDVDELLIHNRKGMATPLHCAVKRGKIELFRFLHGLLNSKQREKILQTGRSDEQRLPALVDCAAADWSRNTDTLMAILDLYPRYAQTTFLKIKDCNGNTVLHKLGYRFCLVDPLVKLVSKYIDPEDIVESISSRNTIGHSVVHTFFYLIQGWQFINALFRRESVETMIECLNTFSNEGTSPLRRLLLESYRLKNSLINVLARYGMTDIMIMLIMYEKPYSDMNLAIMKAVLECFFENSQLLPSNQQPLVERSQVLIRQYYDIKPNDTDPCVRVQLLDQLKLIVESDSDRCHPLVWKDVDGNTILHMAAKFNHHDLTQVILHKESDPRRINRSLLTPNRDQKTPYELATDAKLKHLLQWTRDQIGYYPLLCTPRALVLYTTENRPGSEAELSSIEKTLSLLKLPTTVVKDPTEKEIFLAIRELQTQEEKFAQVVVAMSHGDRGHIWAKDKLVPIRDILLQMNPKAMYGQPKILVIQACQASLPAAGRDGHAASQENNAPELDILDRERWQPDYDSDDDDSDDYDAAPPGSMTSRLTSQHFDIPGPDYITLSATINRGFATRNLMIPILADHLLKSDESEDLHSVFLKTVNDVQYKEPDQVPEFRTTMNRKVCLKRVYSPSSEEDSGGACMIM